MNLVSACVGIEAECYIITMYLSRQTIAFLGLRLNHYQYIIRHLRENNYVYSNPISNLMFYQQFLYKYNIN